MDEKVVTTKKKWGISLIAIPIVLWVIVAVVNGFSTSKCWTASCGMDWMLGILAVITVIVGIVLFFSKEE